MGKFSAAKMTGAQDVKMQNKFNQLIDLLETGYVSESMLGGHKVRISVDPRGGLQILSDDVQIGGIILIDGVPVNIAGAMTNDATDPAFWAKIGEELFYGVSHKGIFGFNADYSESVPTIKIYTNSTGVVRISPDHGNFLYLNDTPDIDGRSHYSLGLGSSAGNGFLVFSVQDAAGSVISGGGCNATEAKFTFGTHQIGCDATGPYYIVSGGAKKRLT